MKIILSIFCLESPFNHLQWNVKILYSLFSKISFSPLCYSGLIYYIYVHACRLHFIALYYALQILHFLQIEDLWHPCLEHHFSYSICSLHVSESHSGNPCTIPDFIIIVFVMVISICLMLLL